jgi:hypothetical protein
LCVHESRYLKDFVLKQTYGIETDMVDLDLDVLFDQQNIDRATQEEIIAAVEDVGKISYVWSGTSSQMFAIYMTCVHRVDTKYVMVCQEDVKLPKELYTPCNWMDEDSSIVCLSFLTRANRLTHSDGSKNIIVVFQDTLSKVEGLMSIFQVWCTPCIYSSSEDSLELTYPRI